MKPHSKWQDRLSDSIRAQKANRKYIKLDTLTRKFVAIQKTQCHHQRYILLYNLCLYLKDLRIDSLEIRCKHSFVYSLDISNVFNWATSYNWTTEIIQITNQSKARVYSGRYVDTSNFYLSTMARHLYGERRNILDDCLFQQSVHQYNLAAATNPLLINA